jgi:poly(3-hydroxybutyrate) depolymerase
MQIAFFPDFKAKKHYITYNSSIGGRAKITVLYQLYELQHALLTPVRFQAEVARNLFQSPWNPLSYTQAGRAMAAGAELLERSTRRFGRPDFKLHETTIDGKKVEVAEEIIVDKPWGNLLHFKRNIKRNDPKVLIVAPMSGHYATLLRGTVKALLPHHEVYITDWEDARQVPLKDGPFNLDSYITYLREYLSLLGPETHLIAVCQPAPGTLATVALMASENDPNQPLSMTLMGGPVDTRISKTEVTDLAENRPMSWFEKSVIQEVPFYYPGAFRKVYPGFLQLTGFMSMNLDRHVGSHMKFFQHLITGDGSSADAHRKFYDEYLSVMDIPAEFYLQTIETVFQRHLLPRGLMKWRDPLNNQLVDVRPQDIEHTALLTIEGELDDISARGQTTAAHELCYSLPQHKQYHHFQLQTGHYGIFNGRKWREEIMPRIRHFIRLMDPDKDPVPKNDLERVADLAPERYNRDKHGIVAIRRWLKQNQQHNYKEMAD